ncbi:MAG: DUF368 domain-containing protein [Clostridia bacterium]|nr:DUF368 domain-containing protein [Clostridia bacterium]
MTKILLSSLLYALQGAIVGVGAILPGISGGVLCVVFGVYEPMMEFLSNPIKCFKKHLKILIPFAIGWVLGFVLLAKLVEFVFGLCQPAALMLFFGLICGTLPEMLVAKDAQEGNTSKSWMPFVISLSFAYLLFHLIEVGVQTTMAPSFPAFIFCGVLWGLSTIVPGMTSSAILIELGLYEELTAGIGSLHLPVMIPFLIGIIATVLLLARLINMLYKKHNLLICRVILGFVIASSLKIIPTDFLSPTVMIVSIVCFVAGFAAARAMDIWGAHHQHH